MLLSEFSNQAREQGLLSQLVPVMLSLFFLCPLPKIPRKAGKSDRLRDQSSALLPGYPPLNLRGTWGHSLWLNKWLLCPGGINLMQARQHKPCIFMGSFQRSCTGSELLFSSKAQHPQHGCEWRAMSQAHSAASLPSPAEQLCICTDLSFLELV